MKSKRCTTDLLFVFVPSLPGLIFHRYSIVEMFPRKLPDPFLNNMIKTVGI